MVPFCCDFSTAFWNMLLCPDRVCSPLLALPLHRTTGWVDGPWCLLAKYPALSSQKSKSDIVLLLVHKSIYNIHSDRVQGKRANTTMQCWPKMRGLKFLGVKNAPGHSSLPGTLEDWHGPTYKLKYGDGYLREFRGIFIMCPTILDS